MLIFLNGTAMAGGAGHWALQGATLLGPARTAPRYRFYSVRDDFPGLVPVDTQGASIEGELYDLPDEVWRDSLGPSEPPELFLGEIELDDGRAVNAMILDLTAGQEGDAVDITDHGGWRAYLATKTR